MTLCCQNPNRQGELVAAYQKSDLRRENEQQLLMYRCLGTHTPRVCTCSRPRTDGIFK